MGKKFRKVLTGMVGVGLMLGAFGSVTASAEDLSSHWAGAQVGRWVAAGYINGYNDGAVKPDASITRAEFAALVSRAFITPASSVPNVTYSTYGATMVNPSFSDLSVNNWAYSHLMTAVQAGYLSGYPDGTIRPNKLITRQEAAAIVAKVIGLTNGDTAVLQRFSDSAKVASWSKRSVTEVIQQGYMHGYPDGTFRPTKSLTRAEAIVLLDAASGYTMDNMNSSVAPSKNKGTVTGDTYGDIR